MEASARARSEIFAGLKTALDVRAAGRTVMGSRLAIPSGLPELDYSLAGGFIRGSIVSLEGLPSSGRTAVLASTLFEATKTGLAAVIDDGTLYPPDLERAGVLLERLFIVTAGKPLAVARSADVLLRSRAFRMVAMPAVPLRATIWSRLAALAQKADALVVTHSIHASNELGYFASTRVRCAMEQIEWSGTGWLCELQGYSIGAHVLKHRGVVRSGGAVRASC